MRSWAVLLIIAFGFSDAAAQWSVNQAVEAKVHGTWVRSRVVSVENARVTVRALEGDHRGDDQWVWDLRPVGGYAVGDRVTVETSGEWKPGEVLAVTDDDVRVRLDDPNATWREYDYWYRKVRPAQAAGGDGQALVVGQRVEVQAGQAWEPARLLAIEGGLLQVEYEDENRTPRERRVQPRFVRAAESVNEALARGQDALAREQEALAREQDALAREQANRSAEGNGNAVAGESGPSIPTLTAPTASRWAMAPVVQTPPASYRAEIPLRGAIDSVFYRIESVVFGEPDDAGVVPFVVAHVDGRPGNRKMVLETGRLEAMRGRASVMVQAPDGARLLAVDAGADRAAVVVEGWGRADWSVKVIALGRPGPAEVQHEWLFESQWEADAFSATFLPGDRLLVTFDEGTRAFDLTTGESLWAIAGSRSHRVRFDSTTGLLCGDVGGAMAVVNPSGAPPSWLVYEPDAGPGRDQLVPRADRQVMARAGRRLGFFEVDTLQTTARLWPSEEGLFVGEWLDDRYWLTEDGRVVDSRRGAVVWSLESSAADAAWGRIGLSLWQIQTRRDRPVLSITPWLTPTLRATWDELNLVDVWGFGPGVAVQLSIADQDLAAALQTQLERQGIGIDRGARYRLATRIENHDAVEMEFRRLHGGFGEVERMTVTPRTYWLELFEDSEVVWSASSHQGAPTGIMSMFEGQSIADAARAAMALDWSGRFNPQEIPERLPQARHARGLGTTSID